LRYSCWITIVAYNNQDRDDGDAAEKQYAL